MPPKHPKLIIDWIGLLIGLTSLAIGIYLLTQNSKSNEIQRINNVTQQEDPAYPLVPVIPPQLINVNWRVLKNGTKEFKTYTSTGSEFFSILNGDLICQLSGRYTIFFSILTPGSFGNSDYLDLYVQKKYFKAPDNDDPVKDLTTLPLKLLLRLERVYLVRDSAQSSGQVSCNDEFLLQDSVVLFPRPVFSNAEQVDAQIVAQYIIIPSFYMS